MRILAHVRFYPPHSLCGSDMYLHSLLKWLQSRGHEVVVMLGESAKEVPYEYEGIQVVAKPYLGMPYIATADIVFTQLDFTSATSEMIKTKPIIWFYHNHSRYGVVQRCKERMIVVYNSETAKKENQYPNNRSLVLTPPVDVDYYDVPREKDGCITLINMNDAKGAEVFWKLAKELPEYKFLAVKGSYGIQIIESLPNVEVMERQQDMREVYRKTRILIMPSKYESWGMTATEASASGIPVICTDTPGLRENMGEAGIYCDRNNINEWVMAIRKLKGKKEYAEQSAKVRERSLAHRPDTKLEVFEEEICRIAKKPAPSKKQEYQWQ